jgi:23S rRNA pseudouridine2605 synthase
MTRNQGNNNGKKKETSSKLGGLKKPSTSAGNEPIRNKAKSKSKTKANSKVKFVSKAEKPVSVPKLSVPKTPKKPDELRLNKYISNSGICSRRDADIYIQSGNVKVNGVVITEMGHTVKLSDVVIFDGVTLIPEKKEYILLNKPKNFSTTGDDESNAPSVLDLVRGATKSKIQPVGRMDKTTTGLLLFTNDRDVVRKYTESNQKTSKLYQVTLDKNLRFEDLEKIAAGLTIDGHRVYTEEVTYIENQPKSEIGIKMKTSNIKVIRKIFEYLKYDVIKLDRVTFAGLTKKNLPRGNYRFLTEQEIINIKNI